MGRVVGIDLGTTKCVAAVLDAGQPSIVPTAEGTRTMPSVVAFARTGQLLVGQPAKNQAVTNPHRTFDSFKRHMGTGWTTPDVDGRRYTPQELSALLLQKLKRDAEACLGAEVTDAVITVPAYFEDAQRQATKEAGEIAGLDVLRIINEPTSAALAYGFDRNPDEQTILVFDLGGGTFDVSLLEITEQVVEVKATSGDNHLGGNDWDERIVGGLVERFRRAHGVDLTGERVPMQRVREAAERAKIELSGQRSASIALPYLARDRDRDLIGLDEVLDRVEFQRITADLLDRLRAPFTQVLRDCYRFPGTGAEDRAEWIDEVHQVVLVGGSTRMPAVVDLVRELARGREPNRSVNPDEVVAVGAALQAGVLTGEVKDILLLDVVAMSLGIETAGGVRTTMIARNTTIPTRRSEVFTTDVDGALALYPRPGRSESIDLRDPAALDRAAGPTARKDPFTSDDTGNGVAIRVYEGEHETAAETTLLGEFTLTGLPAAPAGELQIEVSFDIDANGIVHVSATDLGSKRTESMTVSGRTALDGEVLDRMKRDAARFAEQNRRRRDEVEVRGQAEALLHESERFLRERRPAVPEEELAGMWEGIGAVRFALARLDAGAIKQATEILAAASQRVGAALYAEGASTARVPRPRRRRNPTGGVFISYRNDDTGPFAGRMRDRLEGVFGERRVFMDAEDIAVGADFRTAITDALDRSSVVVALVGKNWRGARDADGRTRIERDDDVLRWELEQAIGLGLFVVPVLVEQAGMPEGHQVPVGLRPFVTVNAVPLSHRTFRRDLAGIVEVVQAALEA